MPRTCTICEHLQRTEIESAYIGRARFSAISRKFRVSQDAVERHLKTHLTVRLADAAERRPPDPGGDDLLAQVRALNIEARAWLEGAKRDKDGALAMKAMRQLTSLLELQANLVGVLRDRQVNVITNLNLDPAALAKVATVFLRTQPAQLAEPAAPPIEAETVEKEEEEHGLPTHTATVPGNIDRQS